MDPSNTEAVTQKQRMLKNAIEATKEKLTTLKTAAEQANQQLADGKITQEQYDALQREIVETEQNLKSLQEQAAVTNTTLARIDAVGEKMQTVGSAVEGVGKKFLPVTAAVTGLGTAAVKTAADFDQEMSKVSAISGATGDDFDQLRAKAREMGAKTKFSASEAASAMEYMAMAGWKTGDMLDGIEGISKKVMCMGYLPEKKTVSQFDLKCRFARQYLSFAGKSSKAFLLYLSGPGVYDSPAADVESTSVPGRNGDIISENARAGRRRYQRPSRLVKRGSMCSKNR